MMIEYISSLVGRVFKLIEGQPKYDKDRAVLIKNAEWVLRFLSVKLDEYPEQKEKLAEDLWSGAEPAFTETLRELRAAFLRMVMSEDPRAIDLARLFPPLPSVGTLDIDGLKKYLKRVIEEV